MYETVRPLSNYLKIKAVRIDDAIFMLHTKCTVALLLACAALLSARQYFGEPIHCISAESNLNYVTSYCWTMGTYILDYDEDFRQQILLNNSLRQNNHNSMSEFIETYAHAIAIAEGVGPETRGKPDRIYLRYYQWVVMLLLLQSILYYVPRHLWRNLEGQRLGKLCANADGIMLDSKQFGIRLKMLLRYFASDNKSLHSVYMAQYIVCELLNVVVSILNILLLELFFGGFWLSYVQALAAIPMYDWDVWNRMTSRLFPKIAKCEILKFGSSGTANILDNLCVLPLNVLNEKLFAFLWCWFLFIFLLAAINLSYRVIVLRCARLRLSLLHAQVRQLSRAQVVYALNDTSIGDWFLLVRLGGIINPMLFRELIAQLGSERVAPKKLEYFCF